jgi:hypothetical protein
MSVAPQPVVQNSLARQPELFHRWETTMQAAETRMILIVGADADLVEWAAMSLFRAGHIPVLGQWYSPLAGSDAERGTDGIYEIDDPVGPRLLTRCDAVLRVDGDAPEADLLVNTARARGLRVYDNVDDAIAG